MRHPIYLDGPLKGEDRPVDDYFPVLKVPVPPNITDDLSGSLQPKVISYTIREYALVSGGERVLLGLAYIGPHEPTARVIAEAIIKPELMEHAEIEVPRWAPDEED